LLLLLFLLPLPTSLSTTPSTVIPAIAETKGDREVMIGAASPARGTASGTVAIIFGLNLRVEIATTKE
jgi:hypothetical protein